MKRAEGLEAQIAILNREVAQYKAEVAVYRQLESWLAEKKAAAQHAVVDKLKHMIGDVASEAVSPEDGVASSARDVLPLAGQMEIINQIQQWIAEKKGTGTP